MSIHKSKGLEFPIVFLSGTGKQFNMQDLNKDILLHQDLGLGPKYINYERNIQYSTLAREAIKLKLRNETLSEEMRILYVALTRAREKLIITGIDKDYNKSMEWKKARINDEEKINKSLILKSKSYLDWLELISIKCKNDILKVTLHTKNTEKTDSIGNEIIEKEIKEEMNNIDSNLNKTLNWEYPYSKIALLEGKSSVSKLSHKNKEVIEIATKPKFMDIKKLSSSEKGTLMHLVLQKLDFRKTYSLDDIKELLNDLVMKEIILGEEVKYIDANKILEFTKSKLYKRIQNAKHIFKEQPFYINLQNEEFKDEKILVQGIIDLYFIEENENIVLVDYKTDYIEKDKNELIIKYQKQLELYKKAIEKSLKKNVNEVYIYSTFLSTEIKI